MASRWSRSRRTRLGAYEVHREKDRISLRAGSGKSALSWSFRPPAEADKWTTAIRAVIRNAKSD